MKTRNSLVSNSSTSSFVLIVTESLHQRIVSTFKESEKKFLDEAMSKSVFNGTDIRIHSSITDMGGERHPDLNDFVKGDDDIDTYGVFDLYRSAVEKNKNECISEGADC